MMFPAIIGKFIRSLMVGPAPSVEILLDDPIERMFETKSLVRWPILVGIGLAVGVSLIIVVSLWAVVIPS